MKTIGRTIAKLLSTQPVTGAPRGAIADAQLVDALYRALFDREPDAEGMAHHLASLKDGATPQSVIQAMLRSPELKRRLPEFVERYGLLPEGSLTLDVSQFGEFQLLLARMVDRACPVKYLVDVGARGRQLSNTYDLMRHFAWRGLLIEANPALAPEIERDFAGLDFILSECAVADYEGTGTLTLGCNDDVSSLLPDHAGAFGLTRGMVEVRVARLATLLTEHHVPSRFGLLSIDIEGFDVAAVNDLIGASDYRPTWIIIELGAEALSQDLAASRLSQAVQDEYALVGCTIANWILERRV